MQNPNKDEYVDEIADELWTEMAEAYGQGFCPVYGGVEEAEENDMSSANNISSLENTDVNDFPDDIPF